MNYWGFTTKEEGVHDDRVGLELVVSTTVILVTTNSTFCFDPETV